MISQQAQRFTGYWIPAELSKLGLSKIEQFLLSMIDSLDSGDPDYCFASNAYLAKQMDLSESRVSFYITKFKRMGLIEEVSFSGRTRRLKTLKSNWYKEIPREKSKDSKKELCVKTRRQTTRKQEGRLRENTQHIENLDNKAKEQQQPSRTKKSDNYKKVVVVASPSSLFSSPIEQDLSLEEFEKIQLLQDFQLTKRSIDICLEKPIETLKTAIQAVKEYAETKDIDSIEAILQKAIREEWKPKKKLESAKKNNKRKTDDEIDNIEMNKLYADQKIKKHWESFKPGKRPQHLHDRVGFDNEKLYFNETNFTELFDQKFCEALK